MNVVVRKMDGLKTIEKVPEIQPWSLIKVFTNKQQQNTTLEGTRTYRWLLTCAQEIVDMQMSKK